MIGLQHLKTCYQWSMIFDHADNTGEVLVVEVSRPWVMTGASVSMMTYHVSTLVILSVSMPRPVVCFLFSFAISVKIIKLLIVIDFPSFGCSLTYLPLC